MTDQGWGNADGSARGTATGNTGGNEDGGDGGVDTRKVVPFPREWYGSPDELVPIDLGAPAVDATDAAETDATDAAAFWEGGAGGDHELTEPSHARLRDPAPSGMAARTPTGGRLKPSKPASRRRMVRSLAVAASLALIFAGVATVLVSGLGAGPGTGLGTRTQRQDASRAVTHTVTTPVTVTTTVPARDRVKRRPTTQTRVGNPAGATAPSGTPPVVQQSAVGTETATGTDDAPSRMTSQPSSTTGGGSHNSGTGCAESPDSGCLP